MSCSEGPFFSEIVYKRKLVSRQCYPSGGGQHRGGPCVHGRHQSVDPAGEWCVPHLTGRHQTVHDGGDQGRPPPRGQQ